MEDVYIVRYFHTGLKGYENRTFGSGAHGYALARAFFDSIVAANYPRFCVKIIFNSYIIDAKRKMDY